MERTGTGCAGVWNAAGALVLACLSVGCVPVKAEKGKYASSMSGGWEGRSLHIEGVGSIPCVKFSVAPGGCVVFHRKPDRSIVPLAGKCDLEGSTTGTYLSLNCEKSGQPCVPGDNRILINMNTSDKITGDESQVVDSNLQRKITVLSGTCEQDLGLAAAPGAAGVQGAQPGQPAQPAQPVAAAPQSVDAEITQALSTAWNGRAVEFDNGTHVVCINFTTAANGCTQFTKYKTTGNVKGPESAGCAVASRSEGLILEARFGNAIASNITLTEAAEGNENAFADKAGTRFWKLRQKPCLSTNF